MPRYVRDAFGVVYGLAAFALLAGGVWSLATDPEDFDTHRFALIPLFAFLPAVGFAAAAALFLSRRERPRAWRTTALVALAGVVPVWTWLAFSPFGWLFAVMLLAVVPTGLRGGPARI